jgi:hypothetical protein
MLKEWGSTGKMNVKEYGVSVASRAVMFFNQHHAKVSGRRMLTKPELYAVNRTIDSNLTRMQTALSGVYISQPRCEVYTSTVPLLAMLKPRDIPPHKLNTVLEVGRISGVSRAPATAAAAGQPGDELELWSEDDELMNQICTEDPSSSTGEVAQHQKNVEDDEEEEYTIEQFDD